MPQILLLAAEGTSNTEIAQQVGCSRPTVILWRQRYTQHGLDGLGDQPRSGRPQTVRRDRRAEILAATLSPPPEHLGVTYWSSRLLADQLGVSHNTVARVWREYDLKPWRLETFKFSTDPELEVQGALVGGGPWVGKLDDHVGEVLPGQPGDDPMGEGRRGACWREHPRMMPWGPVHACMPLARSATALAHQVVSALRVPRPPGSERGALVAGSVEGSAQDGGSPPG